MSIPSIGRTVIYRHPRGYDLPAVVTATTDSLADFATLHHEPVGERHIRPLSGPEHVHLTVFTPATTSEHGTEKARDIPQAGDLVTGGTWRWAPHEYATIGDLAKQVGIELARRAAKVPPETIRQSK